MMSQETVAQFLEAVKANPELQTKLKESKTVDTIIAQAASAGYNFTASDLEAYGKARAANSELSEDQLENVAGGITWSLICVTWTLAQKVIDEVLQTGET